MNPFFRWVGGKRKIAKILASKVPSGLNNYYEPFLGAGALFFTLKHKFKKCYLSDVNVELVNSFNMVKNNPSLLINLVSDHEKNNSKQYFDNVRQKFYNNDPAFISARFLYLNRYSFRGVYRINKQGNYTSSYSNVEYKKPLDLKQASNYLQNTSIYVNDFSFIEAEKGDFVYFDPPYCDMNKGFYSCQIFSKQEHIRLYKFATSLCIKGVRVMISSNDNEFIRSLYKNFKIEKVDVSYSIRLKNKPASEIIIRNYI